MQDRLTVQWKPAEHCNPTLLVADQWNSIGRSSTPRELSPEHQKISASCIDVEKARDLLDRFPASLARGTHLDLHGTCTVASLVSRVYRF